MYKDITNILFVVAILTLSLQTHASGQHTAFVTFEAINNYKTISTQDKSLPKKPLRYIGSVQPTGEHSATIHLFVAAVTIMPERKEISPGEYYYDGTPWEYVDTFKIDSKEFTIVNGWDITKKVNTGGYHVMPQYCPPVDFQLKLKKYHINPNKNIQAYCMDYRQRH